MKKNSFLITGCAGFIGFHFAQKLLEKKYNVLGIDNLNKYYDVKLKKDRLKILKKNNNFSFSKIDISDKKKLELFFKKNKNIDYILHFAAQAGVRYSLKKPDEYIYSNIIGTFNLLDCIKNNKKINNFLFASSSSVYGDTKTLPFNEKFSAPDPIQLYAATKISNEYTASVYSKLYKKNILCLRLFTVYGPWGRPDMALFNFCKNITKKKEIQLFNNGNHIRDFTYIDDLTGSIPNILDFFNRKKNQFEIVNFCSEKTITLRKYISLIEKNLGRIAKKKLLPLQKGDMVKTFGSKKKLEKTLRYKCKISPEHGIAKYVTWFRNYYNFKN